MAITLLVVEFAGGPHEVTFAAERLLGFRIHALAYVVVMVALVIVNVVIGEPYWVHWVFLGWTPGVLAHWWFGVGPSARGGATG